MNELDLAYKTISIASIPFGRVDFDEEVEPRLLCFKPPYVAKKIQWMLTLEAFLKDVQ